MMKYWVVQLLLYRLHHICLRNVYPKQKKYAKTFLHSLSIFRKKKHLLLMQKKEIFRLQKQKEKISGASV